MMTLLRFIKLVIVEIFILISFSLIISIPEKSPFQKRSHSLKMIAFLKFNQQDDGDRYLIRESDRIVKLIQSVVTLSAFFR